MDLLKLLTTDHYCSASDRVNQFFQRSTTDPSLAKCLFFFPSSTSFSNINQDITFRNVKQFGRFSWSSVIVENLSFALLVRQNDPFANQFVYR